MTPEYMTIIRVICIFFLVSILIFSAISDVLWYKIPNHASIFIIILFFISWNFLPFESSFIEHIGSGVAVLLVGMVLFYFGLFGGGDVKLWAAAATWFGFGTVYVQLAYVSLVGGLIGVCLYVARTIVARSKRPDKGIAFTSVPRLLQADAPVPYGVAIAAGTILALNRNPLFLHLLG